MELFDIIFSILRFDGNIESKRKYPWINFRSVYCTTFPYILHWITIALLAELQKKANILTLIQIFGFLFEKSQYFDFFQKKPKYWLFSEKPKYWLFLHSLRKT